MTAQFRLIRAVTIIVAAALAPALLGPAAAQGYGYGPPPGKPALFLFATEDGTISGWSPGVDMTHAVLKVDNSAGAVYKGLALLGNQLFAANFRGNSVDVFNSDFSPGGSFTDSAVPAGFAP